METKEVIRLLNIEHICSQADCNRECNTCDIVQKQEVLDEMYKTAIALIKEHDQLKADIEKMKPYSKELCKNYIRAGFMGSDCGNGVCRKCKKWEM